MLKQSSSKMKNVLSILLTVLFVVSLTAVAASAYGGGYGRDGRQLLRGNIWIGRIWMGCWKPVPSLLPLRRPTSYCYRLSVL